MGSPNLRFIVYSLSLALAQCAGAAPWSQALSPAAPPAPIGAFDTAAFDGGGAFANAGRTDSLYRLDFEAPPRPDSETLTVYMVSMRVRVGVSNAVWVAFGEGDEAIRVGNEQGAWQIVTGGDARPMTLDWPPWHSGVWWNPTLPGERDILLRFVVAPDGAVAYVMHSLYQPAYLSPPPSLKATPIPAQGYETATLSLRGQNSALISLATRWTNVGTTIIVR